LNKSLIYRGPQSLLVLTFFLCAIVLTIDYTLFLYLQWDELFLGVNSSKKYTSLSLTSLFWVWFVFSTLQWLLFAERSTVQQRACFHWEREGCTLFARSLTSYCQLPATSGLFLCILSMKMMFSFLWFSIISFIFYRRRNLCIISANMRFHCKSTRPWWTFRYACMITCATDIKWWYEHWKVTQQHVVVVVNRRGMKGCFTNFLLTMLRNCSQLYILRLSVRLARNMVAYSSVLRVYTLVWKRSMSFFFLH
jgi:hypothetical protein